MKRKLLLTLTIFLLSPQLFAQEFTSFNSLQYEKGERGGNSINPEGERGGNGGGVWVCQNKDKNETYRKIELVDFYEAENEFQYVIDKYVGHNDVNVILDYYKIRIHEIDRKLSKEIEPYFSTLGNKVKEISTDLKVIDDALYRITPPKGWCEGGKISYQQLANFTNYGTILINKSLANDPQFLLYEWAGLYLHEIVYEYLRDKFHDLTSERARIAVGVIASTLSPVDAKKILEKIGISSNVFKMQFVKIKAGSFVMGSPDQKSNSSEKQVNVTISRDFLITKTEVTQAQYFHIMGVNPSKFKNVEDCPITYTIIKGVKLCPENPVEQIERDDVLAFIAKLNSKETSSVYRLPTEAEWEYAARGGTSSPYSFRIEDINKYAWYEKNSKNHTHEVGSKLPNPYGLYDMHGNVCEWVSDSYERRLPGGLDPNLNQEPDGTLCRGGNYDSYIGDLRSAYRHGTIIYPDKNTGFRLVKNL